MQAGAGEQTFPGILFGEERREVARGEGVARANGFDHFGRKRDLPRHDQFSGGGACELHSLVGSVFDDGVLLIEEGSSEIQEPRNAGLFQDCPVTWRPDRRA